MRLVRVICKYPAQHDFHTNSASAVTYLQRKTTRNLVLVCKMCNPISKKMQYQATLGLVEHFAICIRPDAVIP